ncbi:MAG: RNA-binding transcriptional accessory protein [Desulfobacteraceae bacterium]|nr:RNA-binding transcriptional accessory protein [Desulfobacteraceae bacterium]
MNPSYVNQITNELKLLENQVQAVAQLLAEGSTIPFISRYRKEATGSLDEVAVAAIRDRLAQLEELDARREAIVKSLEQHGHLTDDLAKQVHEAQTLAELEDIYLPYKPKRRTKGMVAREKDLEPLALSIFEQTGTNPEEEAEKFLNPDLGVNSPEEALAGARDIMAEWINENAGVRAAMRELFISKGRIDCKVAAGKEADGAKFKDYFEWQEPVMTVPSHRLLAMRRGENEDILNLSFAPSEEEAIELIEKMTVNGQGADALQVLAAVRDCYKRLLSRSMETEIRVLSKERADEEAIRVFAQNLRELLLASPLGAKMLLALDPGFRTGCKLVVLDPQGKLVHYETIYPHNGEGASKSSGATVKSLCEKFGVEAIAVGNGTAGRETETFVKSLGLKKTIMTVMVNESGASIYSASEAAREEFPDLDLTVRGAVSIGRRLMDPLAELVKIDPKSIGVGQYQHDVDQAHLKKTLDDVVISCVNAVGVDLNRASAQLLTYVSGLGPQLAKNILAHRNENGAFSSRQAIKSVPRLGPKAFEQCAGFLRVQGGINPLDNSAVHPESYHIVEKMAKDLSCTVSDLLEQPELRQKIKLAQYVTESVGMPTLKDIIEELAKPGRDPREKFDIFEFEGGVEKITDLLPGMKLPGIVTNVTRFGAFVDIGVHQDGLVHISQLADHFVKDPADVVKVNQKVKVSVVEVDLDRKRIALSMKTHPDQTTQDKNPKSEPSTPKGQNKNLKVSSKGKNEPFHNPFADAWRKLK